VAVYDDDDMVDSALLRMPATGYVQASDERFRRTFDHIVTALDRGHGLFARYTLDFDDLPGKEGAFDLCAFWVVECEALAGNLVAARRRFQDILERANDVGLFAEETDPKTLRFLGNFPQGFAHIGLINAALTLAACQPGSGTAEPWGHEEAPTGDEARRGT
jgi:GH15 family glucan-1,4-alpha-glucosidase